MRKIFVACPIGDENSPARKRSDQLLKHIIQSAAEKYTSPDSFSVVRGDQINQSGRISLQVLREIIDCDLMIVDLSDLNPNVLYEFGIRQALAKPYILMAEKGQRLPFDLADLRTIFYQLDLDGVDLAKNELQKQIESSINGEQVSFDAELFGAIQRSDGKHDGTRVEDGVLLQITEAFGKVVAIQEELLRSQQLIERKILEISNNGSKSMEQELGLLLVKQIFENPDKVEQVMPIIEKFQQFGQNKNISK